MITIIAAVTRDFGLGRGGDLLFHVSGDMKHFKSVTMGHAIVMGRKTFESFPNGALPGRRNIVISSRREYSAPGAEVYGSLQEALDAVDEDCFVIGGGMVYKEAMPLADCLELTHFEADAPEGTDTWFDAFDADDWQLVEKEDSETDSRTGVSYYFATYRRKK